MAPRTLTIFAIYTAFQVTSGSLRGNVSAAAYVEDKSRANYVFSDPLFNHSSLPLVSCIATCLVEKSCYGVTFNEEHGQCHGYARFSGPVCSSGTKVWTKRSSNAYGEPVTREFLKSIGLLSKFVSSSIYRNLTTSI